MTELLTDSDRTILESLAAHHVAYEKAKKAGVCPHCGAVAPHGMRYTVAIPCVLAPAYERLCHQGLIGIASGGGLSGRGALLTPVGWDAIGQKSP